GEGVLPLSLHGALAISEERGRGSAEGAVAVTRPAAGDGAGPSGAPTGTGPRQIRRRGARLSPAQALFRRLFLSNGLVFTAGTLVDRKSTRLNSSHVKIS